MRVELCCRFCLGDPLPLHLALPGAGKQLGHPSNRPHFLLLLCQDLHRLHHPATQLAPYFSSRVLPLNDRICNDLAVLDGILNPAFFKANVLQSLDQLFLDACLCLDFPFILFAFLTVNCRCLPFLGLCRHHFHHILFRFRLQIGFSGPISQDGDRISIFLLLSFDVINSLAHHCSNVPLPVQRIVTVLGGELIKLRVLGLDPTPFPPAPPSELHKALHVFGHLCLLFDLFIQLCQRLLPLLDIVLQFMNVILFSLLHPHPAESEVVKVLLYLLQRCFNFLDPLLHSLMFKSRMIMIHLRNHPLLFDCMHHATLSTTCHRLELVVNKFSDLLPGVSRFLSELVHQIFGSLAQDSALFNLGLAIAEEADQLGSLVLELDKPFVDLQQLLLPLLSFQLVKPIINFFLDRY
mmetsp:Transcript_1430/g.2333  ORF Transcript_1430/g.2333 Transcript_1430/m.2333 type:complete len:408 (-) Transcript_1430:9-1232(-)